MTATVLNDVAAAEATTARGRRGIYLRRFASDVVGMTALIILGVLVVYAIFVPLMASDAATMINPTRQSLGPSWPTNGNFEQMLGTDHLGRELFVTVAQGLRTSLLIGTVVVLITSTMGWLIGATGAYKGGRVDQFIGRIMDGFNVFPGLLLAMAIVTAVGGSIFTVIVVLSLQAWVVYGRLGRAMVLSERHAEYVLAARVSGASTPRVIVSHLGRTSLPMIISLALVQVPALILAESSLSFLGYGVQPPGTSLGLIIAEERAYLTINSWPLMCAGIVLTIACVCLAFVGMAARRAVSSQLS